MIPNYASMSFYTADLSMLGFCSAGLLRSSSSPLSTLAMPGEGSLRHSSGMRKFLEHQFRIGLQIRLGQPKLSRTQLSLLV